jgi:hypothetical protein
MSRFVDVRGRYINADLVRSFWQTKDGSLHVELTEDEQEIVPGTQAGYTMSQLMGENYIVQVIPTVAPVYAVYKDEEEYFTIPVHYLALCADGSIRGVECCDGWFDTISENGNCEGLYPEDRLDQFPGLGKGADSK